MKLLNKIQQELKAPKNQRNNFGGFNYRSCEDILEAVKPLLGNAILTINDEIVMLGDRFYVKATAILKDGENEISVSAYAREALEKKGMDASQITGATSSYARKYALNGLFLIDDTKDADTKDNNEKVDYKSKLEKVKNLEELKTVWTSLPVEERKALEPIKNTIKKYYENLNLSNEGGVVGKPKRESNGDEAQGLDS